MFASTALVITSTDSPFARLRSYRPYAEVRCHHCKRLLFKWQYQGFANVEVKCARCGTIDVIRLSTS